MHGKEPAYETGGGLSASCCGGNGWNRTNTFSSSARRADYLHYIPEILAGPEGLAPSRSVLETNPSARTSRTYWCPGPVARRLPLFGRQPCICEHLPGEMGGAGRLRSVSSALRMRRAAIVTTAPNWTRRRDLHPRSSALQAGPLAARARRDRNKTAAQVTRREKTSLTSVLNDRG